MNMENLAELILSGNIRASGRLMRMVDDNIAEAQDILAALYPHTGNAYVIGVTGNPGSGKSTLVNQLITQFRKADFSVGCVAIDPSSPFSGGAILGDRVRMQNHSLDAGVYIRSVATRGNLGGISRSTPAMVHILDAMGFSFIIIETVGVGQDEVDICKIADTNIVVTVPGLGDDIQAEKAGLLEIADIFVINKAEKPGAARLQRELKFMLSLQERGKDASWSPAIVNTTATTGEGVVELVEKINAHRSWIASHDASHAHAHKRMQIKHMVRMLAQGDFLARLDAQMQTSEWDDALQKILNQQDDPYSAARALVEKALR